MDAASDCGKYCAFLRVLGVDLLFFATQPHFDVQLSTQKKTSGRPAVLLRAIQALPDIGGIQLSYGGTRQHAFDIY